VPPHGAATELPVDTFPVIDAAPPLQDAAVGLPDVPLTDAPIDIGTLDGETYSAALVGPCATYCGGAVQIELCYPSSTCGKDCEEQECNPECRRGPHGEAKGPCAMEYYYYILCASKGGSVCSRPGLPEIGQCTLEAAALQACLGPEKMGAAR
jgi:hypothetical protein